MNVQLPFDNYRQIISSIGFIPHDKAAIVYFKTYTDHKNYTISIDFDKQEIDYLINNMFTWHL